MYNFIKKEPPVLVEQVLIKKIAKNNNINIKTGGALVNIPSEFELLCNELKNSFLKFIRGNWLTLLIVMILIILLYYRYNYAKKIKKQQKIEAKILYDKYQSELLNKKKSIKIEEKLLNDNIDNIDIVRNLYANFDDSKNKNSLTINNENDLFSDKYADY